MSEQRGSRKRWPGEGDLDYSNPHDTYNLGVKRGCKALAHALRDFTSAEVEAARLVFVATPGWWGDAFPAAVTAVLVARRAKAGL